MNAVAEWMRRIWKKDPKEPRAPVTRDWGIKTLVTRKKWDDDGSRKESDRHDGHRKAEMRRERTRREMARESRKANRR